MNRNAEIRQAISNVEAEMRERMRAERTRHNQRLNDCYETHAKEVRSIEAEAAEKRNRLRAELNRLRYEIQESGRSQGEANAPVNHSEDNPAPRLSIIEREGKNWVRVQVMNEDFIITPHDLDNGKDDFDYDTAMQRLKELGLDTFNRKQGFIITTLIEEINAKLVEAGGDEFAGDRYVCSELWRPVGSSADYNGGYTWCFDGRNGCFTNCSRYYSYFRSRPVLAYSTSKR